MILFYILIAVIILALAFEIGAGTQKRKHRRKGDCRGLMRKVREIVRENSPALTFPIFKEELIINTQQAKALGLVLGVGQECISGRGIYNFFYILPETIIPGVELMLEGEEKKGDQPYHLVFDNQLRPRYVRYGYEGEEDSLPYSEYGEDDWWWKEGWKQARPSMPKNSVDATVYVIRFLVEYKYITLPKN